MRHVLLPHVILSIAFSLALAEHASATGDVICSSPDKKVSFSFGFGHVPGLAIISADFSAGDQRWSMSGNSGAIPVIVAQGARDEAETVIDFADPNLTAILAYVRLMTTREKTDSITVGTLRIPELGVFPLICD